MPRGAEYIDGPPASDNAIEAGENKIAGAPQGSDVSSSPRFTSTLYLPHVGVPDKNRRNQRLLESIGRTKLLRCQRESAR